MTAAATTTGRARTVAELQQTFAGFMTEAGWRRGLALRPRADDVFIATYPKSGTTWLQQIVHGLRTGGDMRFDEITAVVPWLEMAHDLGMDPDAAQVASPRAFKSHLSYEDIPKGGRYICAIRDPVDVVASMHRFFDGWRIEPGAITLDEFATGFFLRREGPRRYWPHVLSWWCARRRDDVLLVAYEDMLRDLAGTVARVAGFIGIRAQTALLERVVHQSSFAYMKRHESQFDDHLVRAARDAACGLPPGGASTKVATGTAGAQRERLSPDTRAAFDTAWREQITSVTGLADYAAMRAALAPDVRS